MRIISSLLLTFIASTAFANLPYFPLNFPRDEGAHHANVPYDINQLIEWWYLNGKLVSDDGKTFGYNVAIFNSSMQLQGGEIISMPLIHTQIADLENKKTYNTINTYPISTGYFGTTHLAMGIAPDMSFTENTEDGSYNLTVYPDASVHRLEFSLTLTPGNFVLANQTGLIQMPENTNSYYYFIPHLKTSGYITVASKTYFVKPDNGDSWMEHQWGDFTVKNYGWEFLSIRLQNGLDAHVFMNVEFGTKKVVDGFADIVMPNGEVRSIPSSRFTLTRSNNWHDPVMNQDYPQTFIIDIPELKLHVESNAAFPEQEANGYWEGYCNATGTYNGQSLPGYGYTELVYDSPEQHSVLTK